MPASFVDEQVQFVATAAALEEDLAGVGSSDSRPAALLQRAPARTSTRPVFRRRPSPARARRRMRPHRSPSAPRSPRWSSNTASSGGGDQGCARAGRPGVGPAGVGAHPEPGHRRRVGPDLGNGKYLLLQITSRTPTPYAKAKAAVANAVQAKGATATQNGTHRRRAPLRGERQPAVRGLGAGQRLGPGTPGAGADGRAERQRQRRPRARRHRSRARRRPSPSSG